MVARRRPSSRILRRRFPSLLHPVFRRAPVEGTVGLRNPASCDPVRERGDQVFGERTRATTGFEFFPNDDFFPDIANLFIDMGDVHGSAAAAAATATATATYVFFFCLVHMLLEFLLVVVALAWICLSTVLVDHMISLILLIIVINCLPISWIKSSTKWLIYSTIQKPDYRQFVSPGFLASMKPFPFKGVLYKRWRMRAVYWFQNSNCYAATKGKPEGELNPDQQEAFEKLDTLFKSALLSILDDSIVVSYMSFDTGKDMWDALEAKFGASDAGSELYVMEQFYDYKMIDERSVV